MEEEEDDKPALDDEFQQQKHEWRQEQHRIAAQVVIVPDENDEHQECDPTQPMTRTFVFGLRQQFRYIPLSWYERYDIASRISSCNNPHLIGGVDVSFPKEEGDDASIAIAAYGIVDLRLQTAVYSDVKKYHVKVPYIPSYLAFREVEPLVELIERQKADRPELTPRAILVDGNGIFHERYAGLACFVGVLTQLATIGVGKTCSAIHGITLSHVNHEMEETLQELMQETSHNGVALQLRQRQSHCGDGIILRQRQRQRQSMTALDTPIVADEIASSPPPVAAGLSWTLPGTKMDRGPLMQALTPTFCGGIAVPLVSSLNGQALACALIGHGGGVKTVHRGHCDSQKGYFNNKTATTDGVALVRRTSGTKNPIFISVGHNISLQEAVVIASRCCIHARIPEPIRLADSLGRELLRQKKVAKV